MLIKIKNEKEINKMRIAGNILARVFLEIEKHVRHGVTTEYLDKIAEKFIINSGATPAFKNYRGFPAATCISINEEVIHGIPSKRKLREGDIVGIDIGVKIDGYNSDAARTYGVGKISEQNQKLINITQECFYRGIEFAREGNHLFEISSAIQDYAESFNYSVVKAYVGHGIGENIHEAPEVPNYKQNKRGVKLRAGMTLAIEPMINLGTDQVKVLDNGWTVITQDKKNSAHYENTILITHGDPEILSLIT